LVRHVIRWKVSSRGRNSSQRKVGRVGHLGWRLLVYFWLELQWSRRRYGWHRWAKLVHSWLWRRRWWWDGRRVVFFAFSQVHLQNVGQHESLSAVVAGVRPLAVVRSPVYADVPGRGEPLLTDLADIPLLVFTLARARQLAFWYHIHRRQPSRRCRTRGFQHSWQTNHSGTGISPGTCSWPSRASLSTSRRWRTCHHVGSNQIVWW
jgi:hypothetical protein